MRVLTMLVAHGRMAAPAGGVHLYVGCSRVLHLGPLLLGGHIAGGGLPEGHVLRLAVVAVQDPSPPPVLEGRAWPSQRPQSPAMPQTPNGSPPDQGNYPQVVHSSQEYLPASSAPFEVRACFNGCLKPHGTFLHV